MSPAEFFSEDNVHRSRVRAESWADPRQDGDVNVAILFTAATPAGSALAEA